MGTMGIMKKVEKMVFPHKLSLGPPVELFLYLFCHISLGIKKKEIKDSKDRVKPSMYIGGNTKLLVMISRNPCYYRTILPSNIGTDREISIGVHRTFIS
jgi:hypothetical protein